MNEGGVNEGGAREGSDDVTAAFTWLPKCSKPL